MLAERTQPVFVYETMLPVRTCLPAAWGCEIRAAGAHLTTHGLHLQGHNAVLVRARGENIAWSYEQRLQDATRLTDLIAFHDERTPSNVEGKPAQRPGDSRAPDAERLTGDRRRTPAGSATKSGRDSNV